ncbi:MAG: ABC transporter substrate-binding protein [Dehalococcoidia bacterium]|nr:ABC transporter substrate-binding protein [Dehalococcoidia bacterium]
MRRKILLVVMAVLLLLPALACSSEPEEAQVEPVKIGVLLCLTGDLGPMGLKMMQGAELAVTEINDAGGVLGRPVELVKEDGATDPAKGLDRAKKLINVNGVKVIVGPMISGTALSAGGFAKENDVVMVTPSATAGDISKQDWTDYFFRICLLDDLQSEVLSQVVLENGYTRMATMVLNNTYGVGLENSLVKALKEAGWQGEHVVGVRYEEAKKDYLSELQQIKDSKADVVFACTYADDGIIVFKQALDIGLDDIAWLGCDGNHGAGLFKDPKSAEFMAKAIVAGTRTAGGVGAANDKFVTNYTAKFGEEPEVYCDTVYDATWAAAKAIEAAGVYEGKAIRDAMEQLSFEGASGPISFDEKGDRASGTFELWKVEKDAQGKYSNVRIGLVNI